MMTYNIGNEPVYHIIQGDLRFTVLPGGFLITHKNHYLVSKKLRNPYNDLKVINLFEKGIESWLPVTNTKLSENYRFNLETNTVYISKTGILLSDTKVLRSTTQIDLLRKFFGEVEVNELEGGIWNF